MNAQSRYVVEVNVLDEPGLYEVTSTSPTRYFVDTRNPAEPMYVRWRGRGMSLSSPMDYRWHELTFLTAIDENDPDDYVEWTLRTGDIHTFYTTREADHPNGPLYWVSGRRCELIRRIEFMPSSPARDKSDASLPPDGIIALTSVAIPHGGGWAVGVPGVSALVVQVSNLADAEAALVVRAAALIGLDPTTLLVRVQRIRPPGEEAKP